jgi:hypothetical protein
MVGSKAMVVVCDVPLRSAGDGVMDLIASDAALDEAYAWLCDRRKDYSPHDDVGHCVSDGPTSSLGCRKVCCGESTAVT